MERSTKNFELLGLSLIYRTLFHMKRHDVMYRIIK